MLLPRLDGFHASLLVAAFIVMSLICIHPAVLVGVTAALVETVELDPTLLATTFAMGWGLGCAVNPLSGVNVVLASRYGADNWRIAAQQRPVCGPCCTSWQWGCSTCTSTRGCKGTTGR